MFSDDDLETEDIPKHFKKRPRKKVYGIERYSDWFKCWGIWKWYPTEEQRDQALVDLVKHQSNVYTDEERKGKFRKINK